MRNRVTYLLLVALVLLGCSRRQPAAVSDPRPSVYYWRTALQLDSTERDFVAQHHIGRAYVRYFDVVMRDGKPMPNATLSFDDTLPTGVEVVPTIFIVENCLRHDLSGLADKLVRRVLQMNETRDIAGVKQVQIDCDWTRQSMPACFALLREVRDLLHGHGMTLSATIRLHQLSMPAPPVDEGVLMVYNTGDMRVRNGRNPILDYRDVYPYLSQLRDYDLPLCAAYPVFGWRLLFRGTTFKAIVYDTPLADSTLYRRVDDQNYVVVGHSTLVESNSNATDEVHLDPGDSLHIGRPDAASILRVAQALEKERPGINSQVVIYHLDNQHLNHYNDQFYETLLHH